MIHQRWVIGIVLAAIVLAPAGAQTNSKKLRAAYEAHQSDFDYLLGDWEFTSENREYGKFGGRWSAVRLVTGQILDEYRVMSEKGETYYVTSTVRAYNAAQDRWELVGMDGGGGLADTGTGRREGNEIRIEQRFGVAGGKPVTMRIRYYNIGPDHFSWIADQSRDGGQTWVEGYQKIEARRIGPARNQGPLVRMDPVRGK